MSEIQQLIDAAQAALLQTTITGKEYARRAQPTTGKWGEAWSALAHAHELAADPPPAPSAAAYAFGFSMHALKLGTAAPAFARRLALAGGKVLRDDCYPGSPATQFDTFAKLAADNGCKLVLILAGGGPAPALDTIRAHAKAIAAFFKADYPNVLLAVEPMNEPNIGAFQNNPADYATFCSAVYDGVKEADPSVLVWGGATAGDGTAWAKQVLTTGARFDEWSCHPYPAWGFFPDAAGMLRTDVVSGWSQTFWRKADGVGQTLAEALASCGYMGLIHGTEGFNAPTNSPGAPLVARCCSELIAADVFTQSVAAWRKQTRAGVPFAYTGQDDNTFGPSVEDRFGAYRSDGSAKPIVVAMQAVAG